MRTRLVLTAATCVLLAGCANPLSVTVHTRADRGASPVKFASLRDVSARQAPPGSAPQEILSIVGGDRGSGPEIAVDLEWVLSKDRQERLGVPVQIVSACRSSIIEAGRAYGMTWADAASAGRMRVGPDGTIAAPIETRLTYQHAGSVQIKHSHLICHLSREGTVVALR